MAHLNHISTAILLALIPLQQGCSPTCGRQITHMGAYADDPIELYVTAKAGPTLVMAVQELGGSVLSQGLDIRFEEDSSGIPDLWVLNPEQVMQGLGESPCTRPELVLTFSLVGASLDPGEVPPASITTLEEEFDFTYDGRNVELWDGWIVSVTADGITP